MKKLKFERYSRTILEARSIKPSARVWNELSDTLQTIPVKRRRPHFWPAAGLYLCFLGLHIYFQSTFDTRQPILIEPEFHSPVIKETIFKTTLTKRRDLVVVLKLPFDPIKNELTPTSLSSLQGKTVDSGFLRNLSTRLVSIEKDSLLQLETETLLELASQKLHNFQLKDSIRKLKGLELLIEAEAELYSEYQLKTKIIDFIRNGYSKLSIASYESNPK